MKRKIKYFYLLCLASCKMFISQNEWEIKKYYAIDTNVVIIQQEKLIFKKVKLPSYSKKRKIAVEKHVINYVDDKTDLGMIEGYTQTVDGDLLICAIDISDTTKKYCVIGECKGIECDPDIDWADCDACIPINFTLYVPYGTYILVVKFLPSYYSEDSIKLRDCLKNINFNLIDCYCKYYRSQYYDSLYGNMWETTFEFIPVIINEKKKKFIWK